jgi:hypothetical protein
MFSSNQILEISGCIKHKNELRNALEFAIKASRWFEPFTRETNRAKCTYQITDDGRYCIGWNTKDGWNEFPFDFDIDIMSQIIVKHLERQSIAYGPYDGGYDKGFLMRVIPNSFAEEENGIKNPYYGIVEFAPYTCFYAK